ncbi:uncharacterized protein [Ptychodera flava]|uniref:uncharacterized protein n=1 Tax=Ptychodera flava TaxID=63121 RepID=UPI00396A7DCB
MTTRSGRHYSRMADEEQQQPQPEAGEETTEWQRNIATQLTEIRLNNSDDNGIGPGIFRGREDENARRWWQRYKDYVIFKNWPTEKQLRGISLYLTGEAERWYHGQPDDAKNDMEALGTAFLDRFGKCGPIWLYDQMLFKLKQQPTQTVEQYATMLKEKGEKAQKTDREILSFFINGLRPPIQAFVAGKAPADFASAYLQAKTAEVVTAIPQEPSKDNDELQQIIGKLGGLQQEVKDIKTKIDDRRPLREPQRPKQVYGGRTLQHAQGSLCMLWLVMLAVLLLSTRVSSNVNPDIIVRQNFGIVFEPVALVEVAHSYWHVTFSIPRLNFLGLDTIITVMPTEYPCSDVPMPKSCTLHDNQSNLIIRRQSSC